MLSLFFGYREARVAERIVIGFTKETLDTQKFIATSSSKDAPPTRYLNILTLFNTFPRPLRWALQLGHSIHELCVKDLFTFGGNALPPKLTPFGPH